MLECFFFLLLGRVLLSYPSNASFSALRVARLLRSCDSVLDKRHRSRSTLDLLASHFHDLNTTILPDIMSNKMDVDETAIDEGLYSRQLCVKMWLKHPVLTE